ncbi:unnamed protein product [Meganyctiphanes norvegica]|uniref:DUF7920 domain-containing protein n=1 Tax=Meganyctiphanes norvegica TaxID=48144 RepID=A0AAV2PJE3_MEGNR
MWSTRVLTWDGVLHGLRELMSGGVLLSGNTTSDTDPLQLALIQMYNRALNAREAARRLYEFSLRKSQENKVVITSKDVPHGILPQSYSDQFIHDVKVAGRGPDDKIYNRNEDIRQMISRGTTLMSWKDSNNEDILDTVLYANKKFTGGVGDEDETQPENAQVWRSYCLADPDSADKVVAMEKINGEAAHFSVRSFEEQLFIIAGSKNVHMIMGSNDDVEKYIGDRYRIAKEIADAVLKLLDNMEHNKRQILFSLLYYTKSTVCCEILLPQNQHIVNLSYLKEPQIRMFAFTPTCKSDDEPESSFTALPPHLGLDLATALNLPCANYEIIPTHTVDNFIVQSRRKVQSEGHVLYFVKCENGEEHTIGLAKTKTEWYVILRALREKAVYCFTAGKKKHDWNLTERIKSTHKRLRELQEWLKFSDEVLSKWTKLSEEFMRWLNEEVNSGGEEAQQIRPMFPVIWERFCEATNQTTETNQPRLQTQLSFSYSSY